MNIYIYIYIYIPGHTRRFDSLEYYISLRCVALWVICQSHSNGSGAIVKLPKERTQMMNAIRVLQFLLYKLFVINNDPAAPIANSMAWTCSVWAHYVHSTISNTLTPLLLVPHICVSESGQHWFRKWLVAYSAPSHCLNQCCVIVNGNHRNKLQWNFDQKYFHSKKCIWKYRLRKSGHLNQEEMS